jgi:fibronectin-binding autotransporter adhesin
MTTPALSTIIMIPAQNNFRSRIILATTVASLLAAGSQGADVTLTSGDPINTTSFNQPGRWSDGAAPAPGNNYFTGPFMLRTPTAPDAVTFAGDRLSLDAGGELLFKTAGAVTIQNLILNGGTISNGADAAGTAITATLLGDVTVNAPSTISTLVSARNYVIDAAIHGSGALNLIGVGGTTTAFNNINNDFTGPLTLSGSTLVIGALTNGGVSGALGAASSDATNLVFNGGTLRVNGATSSSTDRLFTLNTTGGTIDSATAAAGISFTNTGALALGGTGNRTLTLTGASTVANNFAPIIGDNGGATSVTKSGAGLWILSGNNIYTGTTTISGGTLEFSTASNLGASTAAISLAGGSTLRWATGNTTGFAADRAITLTGTTNANLNTNGNSVTIASNIAGTGGLAKVGNGVLTLSGANTFTGNVSVQNNNGTLRITNSNALGLGTKTVSIQGNQGGAQSPSLRLDGTAGDILLATNLSFNASNDVTAATGTIVNEAGNNVIGGNVALTSGGGGTRLNVLAGSLTMNGNFTMTETARTLILAGADNGLTTGSLSNGANPLSILKEGTGTWVMNGASTHTGTTIVNGGTLVVNTSMTGGGATTAASGANLGVRLAAGGQTYTTSTLTLSGTSKLALDLGTFGNPTAAVVTAGTFAPAAGTTITFSGTKLTAGSTFSLVDYATLAGGGFAGLNLVLPPRAAGTLVDNAANTSVDLNLTAFDYPRWNGGTSGNWDTNTQNWREVNSGTVTAYIQGANGSDGVLFDDDATVVTRTVNLTTKLTPASVTVNNAGAAYTFTGTGNLSGTMELIKSGTGTLVLANTGLNDYSGLTTIAGGTLQLGDGATAGGGTLGSGRVFNNGTLTLNRPDNFALSNFISGTGNLVKLGTNTATLAGALSYSGSTTVSAGTLLINSPATLSGGVTSTGTLGFNAPVTLSGIVAGTGTINIQGGGTNILSGADTNTFSGTTNINRGTLQLNKTGGATALDGTVAVNSGGTLQIMAANQFGADASVTVNPGGTWSNGSSHAQTLENLTISTPTLQTINNVNVTGLYSITTGAHDVNSGQSATANALSISGGANLRLGANGADSTMNIGGGGLTLADGTLQLGQAGGAATGRVNLNGNVTGSGISGITNPNILGLRILDLQGGDRTFNITDGTTTVSPSIENGGVIKTGSGVLALTGSSTYVGDTKVNSGTLLVNGSISGSNVTVTGGTLGGTGFISGNVVVNGNVSPGLLAPASTTGTLTLGNTDLTLGATSTSSFEIGGLGMTDYDRLAGVGNLTLDGTFTLTLVNSFAPIEGDSFDLFDAIAVNGAGFNVATDLLLPALGAGLSWNTSDFVANGVLSVVPEPSAATVLLAGAGALLGFRRRRTA